jgi:uncharacterized protein (TIGR02996 family)
MLDSPSFARALAQVIQAHTLVLLQARFGPVDGEVVSALARQTDRRVLAGLYNLARDCKSLDDFRAAMLRGPLPGQLTAATQEQGFLRSLKDSPDDVTALVYSDWLEERGEPAGAEYLRLLVALGRAETTEAALQAAARLGEHPTRGEAWAVRCCNLLARRPLRFRILEVHRRGDFPEPFTALYGILQSGRLRRGIGVMLPCRSGAVRTYIYDLYTPPEWSGQVPAGRETRGLDVLLRGWYDGVQTGECLVPCPADPQDDILDRDIESLGLSVRALSMIESEGVRTVRELTAMTDEQLFELRSFGETMLKEVQARFAELGLTLGMTY